MCGIFGFLSSSKHGGPGPGDELFTLLVDLVSFAADPARLRVGDMAESARAEVLRKLEAAQAASYAWVGRDAFLAALRDGELQARLRHAAVTVTGWTERLERLSVHAGLTRQADWEFLNRLIVGGKDIAWQIERDICGNFAQVQALAGAPCEESPDAEPQALAHAWQLNLILTSLDRLEVRGRDSAGLAVYLRFPGSGALESFLDGPEDGVAWRHELEGRSRLPALTHGALVRPASSDSTVLAVFKVANEVGKMGDNAAFLRQAIVSDGFFQAALRAPGVELQCLAHTRWASNGIISLPNCHPVDGAIRDGSSGSFCGPGEIVGVLNGDVDNYQDLLERHVRGSGHSIDETITTDAKIIPVVVAHHYRETRDLEEAFCRAFEEFEGSMAIGIMAADHPGEVLFGQKGSGQGLFAGLKEGAAAIASEMYGLVELTPRYVKAEGERIEGGEILRLCSSGDTLEIHLRNAKGSRLLPAERIRTAEITTRDINRGDKPHFFLKEIGESVESVRRTLRGKFEVSGGKACLHLGADVLPPRLIETLRSGQVRRLLIIGQGTAAVAGEGVALLFENALRKARPGFQVTAMKATELSGHHLREDMSDTLVVAVSQSGTTTDTNRTVDMARDRGAWILAIVNRRNSDLVYKSHGVLYTSDGRDIEMSVASTKAFYAQNVAGQLLALALASELRILGNPELAAELKALEGLPLAMARTLELAPDVVRLAAKFAMARRHWAIVGSGMGKIAANEIRIKLSELCYKSIAVDFLEDKKHIDLSSEPLILVCANGIPPAMVSDVAKEVAIFKAHKSIPIVIADEGESRFDPYAAGSVKVPRAGSLDYLLATMVGHLFGYHAAARFDHLAEKLRAIRADVLCTLGAHEVADLALLPPSLTEKVVEMDGVLEAGGLDSGLTARTATRLSRSFEVLLGRLPADVFSRHHEGLFDGIVSSLSDAIVELSRPIDAIKHQAKTVTVGISRGEAPRAEGLLLAAARGFGLEVTEMAESHRRFISAIEPLVEHLEGATLYRVEGLDPLGRPIDCSTIQVLRKTGCAAGILSRSEDPRPLTGTKWGVVKRGDIYMGFGKTDGRKILIVPVVGERTEGHLLLYHLELVQRGRREVRLRALRAREEILEKLQIAITERNLAWDEEIIDRIDNDVLFFESPDAVAEELLERAGQKN